MNEKNNSNRNAWIIVIGFIFILLLVTPLILLYSDTSNKNTSTNTSSTFKTETLEEKSAREQKEIEIHKKYIEEQKIVGLNNLKEIRKAYNTNELSANDKYKGNIYTLYGKLSTIKEDGLMNTLLDKIGVTITYNDNNSIIYVFCDFNSSERNKLIKYNVGDYILFSGTCSSYGNWYNCMIIE